MMQLFSMTATRVATLLRQSSELETGDMSDPLADPVLKRMTPRELADIPFPRPKPRATRRQ